MPFDSDDDMPQAVGLPALSTLYSPVLQMLASATGLTGTALDAARALRLALDAQVPRITRLDALGDFLDGLPAVIAEPQAVDNLAREVLAAAEPCLQGPRLTEFQLQCAARHRDLDWPRLRSGDWDTRSPGGPARTSRALTEWLSVDLTPALQPFWREPLERQLHDTEEAAAMIRLLRLYVLLTLATPSGSPPQTTLNDCARALGLWKAVEKRLSSVLPTRPGGPAPLYGVDDAALPDTPEPEDTSAAREALLDASLVARHHALNLAAGHADIRQAVQPPLSGPMSGPTGTATASKPTSSLTEATITAAADAARSTAADALFAHEEALAERFPLQPLDVLVAHTTCQLIADPIPAMSNREDRLMLAAYEGLRYSLPLALLPEVAELEERLTQLHAEFPWATRAIEAVAGELRARRRLGAVSVAWAPVLLVGPPGTGKTRLARRLAEVVGLPFLPLGVGGSTDSRMLTGTSRGWASGEPSPILRLLRDRCSAQAVVLLDELDKCHQGRASNAAPVQAALLGLLEPESSRRWIDSYLQVPCDLSKLLYIATANRLGTIDPALLSRLRPVLVPTPERRHYPGIVEQVVRDIADDWGLPHAVMPALDVSAISRAAGSVRELVRLVRQEIVREVASAGAPH